MTTNKNKRKISLYKFLIVGFIVLLFINFVPPDSSSSSYSGPTNPCFFWCDNYTNQGPTIHKINSSTSHGFPFEALFIKHKTTVNGVVTFSSSKKIDWHNLAVDAGFVIVPDFLIASITYLVYSSIYKKRKSSTRVTSK